MLPKPELFSRLAEGHAADLTVVTPNRRLAQALTGEFDAFQLGNGRAVWEAPDILPLGAFIERLWEEALYGDAGGDVPLLLSAAQEQHLWEELLADSGLLSIPSAAAQCRDAWRLRHAWRIPAGGGGEDAAAFLAWSAQYEARTRGEIDAARLPDFLPGVLDALRKPKHLVAYAFDIVPPQTQAFLERFPLVHCKPEPVMARAHKQPFRSAREELETAAAWARARLEEGHTRIGVVVPDLARGRKEVVRVFSRVMQPDYLLPGATKHSMPFNVSLGEPLADYPLVEAALALIELSFRELEFPRVSRLVRSPFLGGAESEMTQRARLDARLRRTLSATVSLPKLIASVEHAPRLRSLLERMFLESRKPLSKESPGVWARHFSALLEASGFPGERSLDTAEFQTRAKWHEALGELARLERVAKPQSIGEAWHALRHLCRDTLFQPESADAPIQILGVLESAGLRFDCLWVSGLTDEAWPMEARPNPFIPVALQKKAGVPQASAEASAALDRRLTGEWLHAAAEVVLSYPVAEADRTRCPSPLIAHIREGSLAVPSYPRYRDLIFARKNMLEAEDGRGPAAAPGPVRGGTRVLADQAACPFRAFARWRLGAEPLETPPSGPDARERGKLLHALMKEIWAQLKDSAALRTQNLVPVIQRAADAAVKQAGLEGRFAELERARLAQLADEWLDLEKGRDDFEAIALEQSRTIRVAGLELASRIDRMDRLPDGGHVLIDYKTGAGSLTPKQWEGPRPDDPQLPLYAATASEELAGVAFAKLRPGDMRFMGFAKHKGIVPGLKPALDWPSLLAAWRRDADALGAAFAGGEAAIDPKHDLKTCERCDLQTLCRVYEKFSALAALDEDGA
ncbi:MAG TPA: PD-(D/E)XK nuclease family protein [Burkholderiales bacterium]|nr:PD-(D/E)XK nuclease family protein [Burkholderiales bacterium]